MKHIMGITCTFEEVPEFLAEIYKKSAAGIQVNIKYVQDLDYAGKPYIGARMQILDTEDPTMGDFEIQDLEVASGKGRIKGY